MLAGSGRGVASTAGAAVHAPAEAADPADPPAVGVDPVRRRVIDDPAPHQRERPGGALRLEEGCRRRRRHHAVGVEHPEQLDVVLGRQHREPEVDRPGIAEVAPRAHHGDRRERCHRQRRGAGGGGLAHLDGPRRRGRPCDRRGGIGHVRRLARRPGGQPGDAVVGRGVVDQHQPHRRALPEQALDAVDQHVGRVVDGDDDADHVWPPMLTPSSRRRACPRGWRRPRPSCRSPR